MPKQKLKTSFAGHEPVCGVVALSFATNREFSEVWKWFFRRYKKNTKWKGSTFASDYEPCARYFKTKIVEMKVPHKPQVSLKTFVNMHTVRSKRYLIRVNTHAMYLEDGLVTDQAMCCPVEEHWSKNRRVEGAWIVETKRKRLKNSMEK